MTITTKPRSAHVRLSGDLGYESVDDFVDNVSRLLAQNGDVRNLHLDVSELTFLDSAALSGLLLVHRRTSRSGAELHLDHRPPFLDRILQVTGLLEHFVASNADAAVAE